MTCKCAIQWVDNNGRPTPDNNNAIGYAYHVAYTYHFPSGNSCHIEASQRYPICAAHAEQLNARGMEHWRFDPLS